MMFIKPFNTLIVGVDFSDYSKIVVAQAQALAEHWKARIVFVHAVNEPFFQYASPILGNYKPPSIKEIKDRLVRFYNIQSKQSKIVVAYDSPANLIRKVAKSFSSRLIVAGYTGHSKVAELVFGSTARKLALGNWGPVWIHRGDSVVKPFRVLVPHDLSQNANRSIDLCENLKLLQPLNYEVFFVRERPIPVLDYSMYQDMESQMVKDAQKGMANLLGGYPKILFKETSGNATEKIVEKAKGFDLILLSHKKYRGFLTASETSQLISTTQVPLLII